MDLPDEPKSLGPYKLLRTLGEGGMGVVYEAEQTEPVRRRVALKVIRAGMDTEQVAARFDAERQALAVMDHPGIARVFDAGATESGRPYFVMELVRGVPITEYCDTHKLTTVQRLRLFVEVCRGVQHAHLKGVIHRDLKPSNVLVSVQDDRPMPKIIDFGVAKAVGASLTDQTLVTRAGQFLGTPAYASPEQAVGSELDVDSRTDIYSLGAMLYELLVGVRPLDLSNVADVALGFAIRERDPKPPSSKLTTMTEANQNTIAKHRTTDPRALKRAIQGDLDWIVMKAVEKDRTRRYETASGLAQDVERYLRDEPVVARPPSMAYLVHKYARRHKVGIAAGMAVVAALAVGAVSTTIGWLRAQDAEARALVEAGTAQEVADFLIDLFEVSDPGEARGNVVTAREILDQGRDRVYDELVDQPEIGSRLKNTMGNVYRKLGLYAAADSLLDSALEERRALHPGDHPDVAETLNDLAEVRQLQGRFDEAEPLYKEAIAMRRRVVPGPHEDLALSLSDLGLLHYQRGEFDESDLLFREALEMRRVVHDNQGPEVGASLNNLGGLLSAKGELDEAEPLLREALAMWRGELGEDHPSTTSALNNLANLLFRRQKVDEAEPLMRSVLATRRRIYGDSHPAVATSLNNLGSVLRSQGKPADAEPLLREAVAIQRTVTGSDHPNMGRALQSLGGVLLDQEKFEEAEAAFLEAIEVFEQTLGVEHAQVERARGVLADLYDAWGRPETEGDSGGPS